MTSKAVLTGTHFMSGDDACAEGGMAAGCSFFAGYPITPATEVAERMARRLPQVGGVYIQMEDELASMAAIIGASSAGSRAMTATSGPGFSLMMENIGLAAMLEVPVVLVNIMRGGPSTGLPTLVGQQDVMQARWGSHGDYEIIALSPSSPQESFLLTVDAFNLADHFRVPVMILSDEIVGHMTEKVVIPKKEEIKIVPRSKLKSGSRDFIPYYPDRNDIPPMVLAGEGFHLHATGLTHDEYGYPLITPEAQERLVQRLVRKIRDHTAEIIRTEELYMEDAEVIVISYGCSARTSQEVVEIARERGMKVGLLRLITLWPFAESRIRELASLKRVKAFVVAEINCGQMVYEVERCAGGKAETVLAGFMGGRIFTPEELFCIIEEVTG
ncbi:MAG: 2-oxoglutarate ferredoxin oxidoreductase subunit alpha [Spirochaetes bacterium DG_61]|jgi:2-oxoglutarate ferredoxin oxidoreductase subunit alpha|nr:MAG: 2-oxoglutarate ferredoxin oxidoreductase subunit alpha [Spirochaetes bacterium DG_61]